MIFDIENGLWKSNFVSFLHLPTTYTNVQKLIIFFEYIDF